MPRPKWGQVRDFCIKQRCQETRTNHFHYLKVLPDNSISGTMVSLGSDGDDIPPEMWHRVWKRQLRLAAEDEFWKGLGGEPVRYAIPSPPVVAEPLPAYLRKFLQDVLNFSDEKIEEITREQAQNLLNEYYSGEL